MASVNDALRANMGRVKGSTKASPQKFACVLGRLTALLINPNAKLIADAKKEAGGTTVFAGACYFEDGKYIFETANEPPAKLAGSIKACLTKFAGLSAVETRKSGAGVEEESSESESENNELKTKITNKVKSLTGRLADVAKNDPQKAAPIRAKITQAGAAFKSNHFEEAEQLLEEAEELL
jgi:hypothetical protein